MVLRFVMLLKTNKRTSHIPIVLLTAKADHASRIEGLEHGADAYLIKPFDEKELHTRVHKLLEIRQQIKDYYLSSQGDSPLQKNLHPKEEFFIKECIDLIDKHLLDLDLDVQKMCKLLGMSRTQLHRKLKAITGLSTTKFINKIRLQKAEYLIVHSDQSIKEVAYSTGFNSPGYFRRLFSDEYGFAPSAYRQKKQPHS